jgi:dTDP-glucose pyrophosphorylase
LAEHDARFHLADTLRQADPMAEIVTIDEPTGGTMETCLAAESSIGTGSLIILDCDLTFASAAYESHLRDLAAGRYSADGMLLSFRSDGPQFSYAELADGRVIRTAEKQVISDRALIGSYGFSDATRFFGLAHDIVDRMLLSGNGEYYVSSAYNRLIGTGGIVRLLDVDRYWSVGTPEELRAATNDPAFHTHLRDLGLIAPNGTPLP